MIAQGPLYAEEEGIGWRNGSFLQRASIRGFARIAGELHIAGVVVEHVRRFLGTANEVEAGDEPFLPLKLMRLMWQRQARM